uniref:Ubiquitin carboxyl-terminal hydrolase n=1 Tax=Bionectria ochroleuca TaxID=29856 RepID=A0A8H7NIG0_BIOOC
MEVEHSDPDIIHMEGEPAPLQNEQPQPLRRSGRQPVKPKRLDSSDSAYESPSKKSKVPNTSPGRRRNPKRKVSQQCELVGHLPANLLEEALKPLDTNDIEEWEGWVELESDPAFFNIILRDLGVENVKAQELFTVEQEFMDLLPKPVFGLIFLFEYLPEEDETEDEENPSEIWFANQTTNNACATVALLNIVMNAPGVRLGETLKEFKESTKNLSTALRGHRLSSNPYIRRIHNSLTRRMDHLNADLALENEASEAASKKSKTRYTIKGGKRAQTRRKLKESEYGFHFVAYVPADGYVWELDGLKTKPHRLGPLESTDWTTIARPYIEARMLQYEGTQLSFNLLALCQSPLAVHSQSIARALASLQCFQNSLRSRPDFSDLEISQRENSNFSDASLLSEFQLTEATVETAEVPQSLREQIEQPSISVEEAHNLFEKLTLEVKSTMGEYRSEMIALAEDEHRVQGRKKDYAPALHKWVTKLAEKGALEELIKIS